jgi:hypothetical protein
MAVLLICLLLWLLILTAISHIVGCTLTLESGIHDSMRAESEVPAPTPTPTPTRRD